MNIQLVPQREYQTHSGDGRRHGRIWQNIKG
jgi:hypothetical protein